MGSSVDRAGQPSSGGTSALGGGDGEVVERRSDGLPGSVRAASPSTPRRSGVPRALLRVFLRAESQGGRFSDSVEVPHLEALESSSGEASVLAEADWLRRRSSSSGAPGDRGISEIKASETALFVGQLLFKSWFRGLSARGILAVDEEVGVDGSSRKSVGLSGVVRMFSADELTINVKERPLLGSFFVKGSQTRDGNDEGVISTVFEIDSVVLEDVPLGDLFTTATQSEGVKGLCVSQGAAVLELGPVDGVSLYGKVKISSISFNRNGEQDLRGIGRDSEGTRLAIAIGGLEPILARVGIRKKVVCGRVGSTVLANLADLRVVAKVDGELGHDTRRLGSGPLNDA